MTNFKKKVPTMEIKQDKLNAKQAKLEQILPAEEKAGNIRTSSDCDSDYEDSIPEDMTILPH